MSSPGTFVAVYVLDAVSFLAYIPILCAVQPVAAGTPAGHQSHALGYRDVVRDRVFLQVWALTALVMAVSYFDRKK